MEGPAAEPPQILRAIYPSSGRIEHPSPDVQRPYVTLTYAQSLDAKIAGAGGQQLILSGRESMVMTHWMRSMHDGIMVGIGTAINDDPQLNLRHLPPTTTPRRCPRPIVLDSNLRLSTSCKLLRNYAQDTTLPQPIVICRPADHSRDAAYQERAEALKRHGAALVECPLDSNGTISMREALASLRRLGIGSLMVEGGQRVISSFLAHSPPLMDMLVVTVAPVIVGAAGVGALQDEQVRVPQMEHVRSELLGRDTVVACRVHD
ncbi:hypothetical protein BOTBODRAFT_108453 [Botryobasidium botryosum FD-172 SS1]|uniref:2,5-diamino-6-ribosylamino-4(3H)-pyrimidinone 5'-phosphate reductase n=1 Tax=Botryobasidium botryosum (strain FD-172 SS1) TaxID=930990 RepID=A0A067MJL7_BOTB1|nr:hypothetical protein BOTBODRAFT_108453 [Botryobasidium botryosum FD-172 SS1]